MAQGLGKRPACSCCCVCFCHLACAYYLSLWLHCGLRRDSDAKPPKLVILLVVRVRCLRFRRSHHVNANLAGANCLKRVAVGISLCNSHTKFCQLLQYCPWYIIWLCNTQVHPELHKPGQQWTIEGQHKVNHPGMSDPPNETLAMCRG